MIRPFRDIVIEYGCSDETLTFQVMLPHFVIMVFIDSIIILYDIDLITMAETGSNFTATLYDLSMSLSCDMITAGRLRDNNRFLLCPEFAILDINLTRDVTVLIIEVRYFPDVINSTLVYMALYLCKKCTGNNDNHNHCDNK